MHALTWKAFDQRSSKMQFNSSPDFIGTTIAYFRRGDANLLYGFNVDILSLSSPTENEYNVWSQRQSSLVLPLMFSMKFRLYQNPNSIFFPYAIIGIGPALGFELSKSPGYINSLAESQLMLGAGGYIGGGVDFLWMEDWAFSLDIRYNVAYFNKSVGFVNHFDTFSFGLGFSRALGP
jgi:hypothetical protein